jgi:hypothetical protein
MSTFSPSLVGRSTYHVYSGDGTIEQGWPKEQDWLSLEDL